VVSIVGIDILRFAFGPVDFGECAILGDGGLMRDNGSLL